MPRSMNDDDRPGDAGENKHATARHLAEAGLRAERAGDQTRADELFDEAERTDPEALANVLMENPAPRRRVPAQGFGDDAGVARMSRMVEPGSDAPSRSGITDEGSGADSERR
ncbi:hypothetical protein B0W47_10440 [Komagataeibacter nataicola]|uniref:Uncharacterized protein n=2 Tax=Komagataeibacter nataicola TaxID=265960 RepID=A0A9N7H373_9PROT|nr:hypothetical protein [Komagataeibacter nataicola]AQU87828.1 hypothetical protein B0W47_10440 [Komagataeibacter nataicola]PYD66222.1 hypothetical protein CDI09_09490 [Komagataeibacter nataicola]WEQ57415.1 hypothetical protein LV564_16025 [Komagataeibacter nataicola]WNM10055.1 hypothetical protein RI056_06475 [Komagataeibacter nataicola]